MYFHDWCRTTSQIPGRKYICLKCTKWSSEKIEEPECKFESRSHAEKFKHTWGDDNNCIKCGLNRFRVSYSFYKVGEWGKVIKRILPCQYTDNDWDIKEIIE